MESQCKYASDLLKFYNLQTENHEANHIIINWLIECKILAAQEFKYIEIEIRGTIDPGVYLNTDTPEQTKRLLRQDLKKDDGTEFNTALEVLNYHIAKGWELIDFEVEGSGDMVSRFYLFKVPIQQGN